MLDEVLDLGVLLERWSRRKQDQCKDVAIKWSVVSLEAANNPSQRIYLANKLEARLIVVHSEGSQLAGVILPLGSLCDTCRI